MFNIGGGEFLVIALIALIVLGPERLPHAARQVGKTMGELRRISAGFQEELQGALDHVDEPTRDAIRRNVLTRMPTGTTPLGRGLSSAVQSIGAHSGGAAGEPSDEPAPGKKAPSKKAAAPKKAAVTKKASATKKTTAVKKAPAKKAPAKKAPAKKAPTKKAAAKKAPAKKRTT